MKKDLTPYYIYALVDKDPYAGIGVFYIGLTVDLTKRYKQHLAGDDNEEKTSLIKFLLADESPVAIEILDTAVGKEQAQQLEAFWILYYTLSGTSLTNASPGVLLDIRYLDKEHREKLKTIVGYLVNESEAS